MSKENMDTIFTRLALTLVLLLTVLAAGAGNLPAYYPDTFNRIGTIDGFNLAKRAIIINDSQYYLSDNMVIHTQANEFDTMDKLSKGTTVGFRVLNAGSGRPLIPEIWVLPASANRSTE
ncbi:MAG: hypothetical protein V3R51_03735 [Gammaproteobacteria bacterium]